MSGPRIETLRERVLGWLLSWAFVPPVVVEREEQGVRQHMIVIGSSGVAVKVHVRAESGPERRIPLFAPRRSEKTAYFGFGHRHMRNSDYREYLQVITSHLKNEFARGRCDKGVMIVIHGGMQPPRETVPVSVELYKRIQEDGYYPIFINWDSSLRRAYLQQLFLIHSGLYGLPAGWRSPFYFVAYLVWAFFYGVADVGRSVALLVPGLLIYLRLLWRSSRFYEYPTMLDLDRFKTPKVKLGDWRPELGALRMLRNVVATPIQALALLCMGTITPRAWENLLRRTRAMFRAPKEFDWNRPPDGAAYGDCEGAMAVFLRELAAALPDCPGMEVTLLSYSMGSMIANEAVQYRSGLPYKALVYLAPACYVRRFADAFNTLEAKEDKPEAYVLTLHPRVEAGQRDFGVFGGSVLEWLEELLATPHTYVDRVLGRWDNALHTLHLYEHARDHLHFKCFPYPVEGSKWPRKHTDFYRPDLDPPFWRREFWW